jgi:hypothetical protein
VPERHFALLIFIFFLFSFWLERDRLPLSSIQFKSKHNEEVARRMPRSHPNFPTI